jgi:GTP-binding protein Era
MSPVQESDGAFHHQENPPGNEFFRSGYVAIVGLPNVGKSTLMNCLLGQKISIVTPKPQTTRHKLLGILSTKEFQIVFLDTPGLLKPRYQLQEVMMESTASAIHDADVLLFMVDATSPPGTDDDGGMSHVLRAKASCYLILNKVDLVHKPELLPLMDRFARLGLFKEIFPVSALKGIGTGDLVRFLVKELPVHPPFYPLDIASEHSERFLVSELVREQVFFHCREEIPYSVAVDVVRFEDKEEGKTLIGAEIYVERDSQKGIVIGKGGTKLKQIGASARKEIEILIQKPVFLELHVKVLEDWRQRKQSLDRLGYK